MAADNLPSSSLFIKKLEQSTYLTKCALCFSFSLRTEMDDLQIKILYSAEAKSRKK